MIHAVGRIKKLTQTLRKVVVRDSSGGAGAIESGMAHIPGHDRSQLLLLPEVVDDYVDADNPVRFIEAFVDGLDLAALGFAGTVPIMSPPEPEGKVDCRARRAVNARNLRQAHLSG